MRRRIPATSLVVAALTIAACFNDRLPTSPQSVDPSAVNSTLNADGCVVSSGLVFVDVNTEVSSLIVQLFEGSHESSTATMWETIKRDKLEGKPVQNHIDNLAKWTLEKLSERVLLDPDGPSGVLNATTGSVRLLDLVFDCTGVTPTQLPEPPADFNAAWELVNPSSDAQQFNTNAGDAGAWIPPADEGGTALEDRTLLVIVQQPAEVQVNTPFPKLTNTVDVALAGGKLRAGKKLSVLFCPVSETIDPAVNARAVIAHQKTGVPPGAPAGEGVEYLPPEEGGFIDCDNLNTASWQTEKGFFRQRAMQLAWYAKKALRIVTPKPLYAVHAAIGGSTPFGSPMVGVDPYLVTNIEITSVTPNPATYGETVDVTARLHIADVPENPAPYRNTYVNPDVVYTALAGTPVVNKTQTRGTNLPMAASVNGGARTVAVTDDVNSAASWAFPCLNANTPENPHHTVRVDFAETYVTANAPVYGASTLSRTFTVNRRDLQVTPASGQHRTYGDVIEPPDLTGGITGVQTQCGDEPSRIHADYVTTANQTSEVGGYPITVGVVTFNEPVLETNYNIVRGTSTLTIDPRPITVTVDSKSREYGAANPDFTATWPVAEVKNGDILSTNLGAATATPTSPAGSTHDIDGNVTFADAIDAHDKTHNYAVTLVPGTLTITRAPLEFAIDAGGTHVYGEANEFTSTLGTTRNGDVFMVGFNPPPSTLLPASATPYVITGTLTGVGGATVDNYFRVGSGNTNTFVFPTALLTVTRRPLSVVVAADGFSRQYGEANPDQATLDALAVVQAPTSLVSGDGVTIQVSTTREQFSPVVASGYPLTASLVGPAANRDSYTLASTDGTLTVTPAPLDIGANSIELPFGTTYTPTTLTGSVLFGALNGDNIGVLSSTSPAATATTPPGTYTLLPFLPEPWPNYFVRNRQTGTLTITPVDPPATLTGRWTGTYSWVCTPGDPNRSGSSDVLFTVGGTEDGITYTGTASYLDGSAPFTLTRHTSATLGDVGAPSATGQFIRIVLGEPRTVVYNEFVGSLDGSTISGETLNGDSQGGCSAISGPSGSFSVTRAS